MTQTPKRRQSDNKRRVDYVISAAKATFAFVSFSALSFVGSWGISLNASVAQIKQDLAVVHEKQEFITPWFVEEMKKTREDVKELREEIKQMNKRR